MFDRSDNDNSKETIEFTNSTRDYQVQHWLVPIKLTSPKSNIFINHLVSNKIILHVQLFVYPLRLVEKGGQYPFDTLFDESGSRQKKFSYALGKLTIRRASEKVYLLLLPIYPNITT